MSTHVTGTGDLDPSSQDRLLPNQELSNGGPVALEYLNVSPSYQEKLDSRDLNKADKIMLGSTSAYFLAAGIGAAIGFAVGGPGGAFIGFFAGLAVGIVALSIGLIEHDKIKHPEVELKDLQDFQERLQKCQTKLKDMAKQAIDENSSHIHRDIPMIRLEECSNLIRNYKNKEDKHLNSSNKDLKIDRQLFHQHYESLLKMEELVNPKSKKED